jgi:hypothetical protein
MWVSALIVSNRLSKDRAMKAAYFTPWGFGLLVLACAVAGAQSIAPKTPRAPAAPTDAEVQAPRPAQPDQSATTDSNQPDTTRVDKATDPDAATASHDDATGQSEPAPGRVQAPNSVVSHPDFKTLDVNNRGYLTADDVAANRWLATNFSRCDANHDGRLSQQEFANCK